MAEPEAGMNWWERLVTPRERSEEADREYLLYVILVGMGVLAILFFVIETVSWAIGQVTTFLWATTLISVFAVWGLYALARLWRWRPISWVLIIFLIILASTALLDVGINGISVTLYVFNIILASILIGAQAATIVTGFQSLLYLLIGIAHTQGWVKPEPRAGLASYWATLTVIMSLTALISWLSNRRLQETLIDTWREQERIRRLNRELELQRAQLTEEISRRTAELEETMLDLRQTEREQLQLIEIVRRLESPVIPVFEGVIVLPVVGIIDKTRAAGIVHTLLDGIKRHRAQVALLDITGVPRADETVAQMLIQAVRSANLIGAECILVGVRPDIAQAMIELSLPLESLITFRDLEGGVKYALGRLGWKLVPAKERVPLSSSRSGA